MLPWGATEIIPLLYLGDLQDAVNFDGIIINLLNDVPACEPHRSLHLPFLANGRASLDTVAAVVDAALARGQRVLVHCEEGSERAPLVIAWFLMKRRSMTIDQAYELIKAKRPITRDRRKWLGMYNR